MRCVSGGRDEQGEGRGDRGDRGDTGDRGIDETEERDILKQLGNNN